MKTKLTLICSLFGLTLLAGMILRAADTPPAAPSAPENTPAVAPDETKDDFRAHLARRLGLTAEQQAKLEALRQKQHAEMDAILQDNSLTADAKRTKMREVAASYREQRRALLASGSQERPGQFRGRFQAGAPHCGNLGGPGRPGLAPMAGGPGFGPLAAGLGPREQLKDAIAEKLHLTDEQRDKIEHIGRDIRAKQRDLLKSYQEQMRAVLTPEQQKQVDEWKARRGSGHPPFQAMIDAPAAGEDGDIPAPALAEDMPPPPPGDHDTP